MLKVVFYFNNHNTLGHSIVVFSLVKKLKNSFGDNINIIVIETGFNKINILPFSNYATLFFYPVQDRNYFKKSWAKNNSISLKKILDDFRPDIFITEYFPFYQEPEYPSIIALLEYIKRILHSKIICSCTYLNWTDNTYSLIKNFYDVVFFHLPEDFTFGYRTYLPKNGIYTLDKILNEFHKKIFFTGFLIDYNNQNSRITSDYVRKKLGLNKEKLVIVSRGGRHEYKELIFLAIRIAKWNKDCFFLVSTGLAKESKEFKSITHLSNDLTNIRLSTLIYPYFDDLLKSSDLSINMGGYNTIVRLLYFNKKSIVIPLPNTDQPYNANFLSRFIPCEIIKKEELDASFLNTRMKQLLLMKKSNISKVKKEWFAGLDKTVTAINKLI